MGWEWRRMRLPRGARLQSRRMRKSPTAPPPPEVAEESRVVRQGHVDRSGSRPAGRSRDTVRVRRFETASYENNALASGAPPNASETKAWPGRSNARIDLVSFLVTMSRSTSGVKDTFSVAVELALNSRGERHRALCVVGVG